MNNNFYKLSAEEQETIISIGYRAKKMEVYSTNASMIKRLDRYYKRVSEETIDGKLTAAYYELPVDRLILRPKKKKTLSAKQKEVLQKNSFGKEG